MARKSRTLYAVLGALSHGPKSGYDISRLYDRPHMYFWNESYGQIYPTLKTLLQRGWVEMHRETRQGGPERKIYEITERGQEELGEWIDEPPARLSVRDEHVLKVYFSRPDQRQRSAALIRQRLKALHERLESLDGELNALRDDQLDETERLHREIALDWAHSQVKSQIGWCERSLERLDDGAPEGSEAPEEQEQNKAREEGKKKKKKKKKKL